MPEIKRNSVWRAKEGKYKLRVIHPGRQGARVTCEWLRPLALKGRRFWCEPAQLLAAYEPDTPEGDDDA